MTSRAEPERAATIAELRRRFSAATSERERAEIVLAETDELFEDAWARAVANSAFPPAVLGGLVRGGRLAFEHLRECLQADPRWTEGAGPLVDSLTDEQTAALDAALGPQEQDWLRGALTWKQRPTKHPNFANMLNVGWSSLEVMASPEALAEAAKIAADAALANQEQGVFELSETLSILCALPADDPRREGVPDWCERLEQAIATQGDEAQRDADLRLVAPQLAQAYVCMGEIARALEIADRIEAAETRGANEETIPNSVFAVMRVVLPALSAEHRWHVEQRMRDSLRDDDALELWMFVRSNIVFDVDGFAARYHLAFEREIARTQRLQTSFVSAAWGTMAREPELVPEEHVDAVVETATRVLARWREGELPQLVAAMAARGNANARAFIQRTAKQRKIEWWREWSSFSVLPASELSVVLDSVLEGHSVRWPVSTASALRWISSDVSISCAAVIDELTARAPVEQQAQRALSAVGRMFERGARWLRDGGARDVEADRVAAKIARGEFAASSAFDRVWWELGEAAQRQAWLARPTRADRVGAIVNKRVIESLGGASAGDAYVQRLERWLKQTGQRAGVTR